MTRHTPMISTAAAATITSTAAGHGSLASPRTQAEADAKTLALEDAAAEVIRRGCSLASGAGLRRKGSSGGGVNVGGGVGSGGGGGRGGGSHHGIGGGGDDDISGAAEAVAHLEATCGAEHLAVASARRTLIDGLRRRLQQPASLGTLAPAPPASASSASSVSSTNATSAASTTDAVCMLLEHALGLWKTQRRLLGPVHPEYVMASKNLARKRRMTALMEATISS